MNKGRWSIARLFNTNIFFVFEYNSMNINGIDYLLTTIVNRSSVSLGIFLPTGVARMTFINEVAYECEISIFNAPG